MVLIESDLFIAVLGITGTGKSSFIRKVTGDETVIVGETSNSCTQQIRAHRCYVNGRRVWLIDTPGFDDMLRKDSDLLTELTIFLSQQYRIGIKLSGVIYMHNISTTRITHSIHRNIRLLEALCGPDYLKRVFLVSSFWDIVSRDIGARREQEWAEKPEFWGHLVRGGCKVARFLRTKESGMEIVREIAQAVPLPMSIQVELVDEERSIDETNAGQYIQSEFERQIRTLKQELDETRNQSEIEKESLEKQIKELTEIKENQSKDWKERLEAFELKIFWMKVIWATVAVVVGVALFLIFSTARPEPTHIRTIHTPMPTPNTFNIVNNGVIKSLQSEIDWGKVAIAGASAVAVGAGAIYLAPIFAGWLGITSTATAASSALGIGTAAGGATTVGGAAGTAGYLTYEAAGGSYDYVKKNWVAPPVGNLAPYS